MLQRVPKVQGICNKEIKITMFKNFISEIQKMARKYKMLYLKQTKNSKQETNESDPFIYTRMSFV